MKKVDMIIYTDSLITCRGDGKPKTGKALTDVGLMKNAGIVVENGRILKIGTCREISEGFSVRDEGVEINAGNRVVMPGFIDSHTHPIYAGNRINEFIMRAQGATYQEIHGAGGGIQYTVDETRKADDETLFALGAEVLNRMLEHGTTTVEAKSGYGLDTAEELRELRIIRRLNETMPLDVLPTFMGAHSIPSGYKDRRREYVDKVINEMIPAVRSENLARFIDVFCEEGAFTPEETEEILMAGSKAGLLMKVHAEEFSNLGGAKLAGRLGAVSADHLLKISTDDVDFLTETDTVLTLMPGTLFFLNLKEYAPAREIIDRGAKIALATDFNAGSCMSESMQMAMSLACIAMKMTPEEAINSATYNAGFAVGMNNEIGSIEDGKKADFIICDTCDYRTIPYHFGVNMVRMVIKSGRVVVDRMEHI